MTMELVVHDPKDQYWEGAIVDAARARALAAYGAVTIPVDPELLKRNAVAGFYKRAWGSGWELNPAVPLKVSPMVLYLIPSFTLLHWRARLVPDGSKVRPSGQLRLVGDSSQAGTVNTGLSALEDTVAVLDRLEESPDKAGGWTVGGRAKIHPQSEGYCGLMMFGAGQGVRVEWVAVSQTGE